MMDSEQGKLFVGGISWETKEETLSEHFDKYGEVVESVVMRDRMTGSARGFGFVLFSDPSAADKALQEKHVILGRTVEVKKAVPKGEQHHPHQHQHHLHNKGSSRNGSSSSGSNTNGSGIPFRTKKIFAENQIPTLNSQNPNSFDSNRNMENLHLFIQSPFPQIPSRFISINPNFSLRDLSLSLSLPSKTLDSFFFSMNGSPLPNSSSPLHSMLPTTTPSPTLLLHLRLPGGGGDGGATGAESRDCYLNMYAEKKPDKADPNETRLSKWCSCALSADPLRHPCVADRLGNLFNKEPLVEALLAKTLPREFAHIRGLKDMIPIHLSEIPGLNSDDNGISFGARFQCPIAGLEFNGKYRFYALRGCGHVVSAKALKEVKSAECLVCHHRFSEEDKIVINGTPEEVAAMREKMEEERMKLKEKKEKKARNGVVEGVCLGNAKRCLDEMGESLLPPPGVKGVNLNDGNGKNSKMVDGVKGASLNASAKRFKAVDLAPAKATKEVYASIFTSSRKSEFKETYSCRSLPLGRN